MVKRSLTNSIVIKKKNKVERKSPKKSPISENFKKYLNKDKNDKEKKRTQMNELIDKIPKHKLDKLINKRIDGKDINEKYKQIKENPEIYFTIEELSGMIERKKISIDSKNTPKNIPKGSIKIINQKKKNKFTRKKPSKVKDINEIEENIKKQNEKREIVKEIKKELKKQTPKKNPKKTPKQKQKKQNPKQTPKQKKKTPTNSKKNLKRSNKKSNKNSKNVNIKQKKITEKEVLIIDKHIKSIRSKKTDDIKKELEKDGIKVSGKSKRLLKDIYLYSKICGINIKHEQ